MAKGYLCFPMIIWPTELHVLGALTPPHNIALTSST